MELRLSCTNPSIWGLFHQQYFSRGSNLMEISYNYDSIAGHEIAANFCISFIAVVSCAKFWSNHGIRIWMRDSPNFHPIWIKMDQWLVKWTPGWYNALLIYWYIMVSFLRTHERCPIVMRLFCGIMVYTKFNLFFFRIMFNIMLYSTAICQEPVV